MRQMVFFLTHNFRPAFRRTLEAVSRSRLEGYDLEILLDDRFDTPADLDLGRYRVTKCRRHPSAFDPLGQAHNFYIDRLSSSPSTVDSFEYFWVVENDVYFHGDMLGFFEEHAPFDTDLLVPEFGHRHPKWCWLGSARGLKPEPCGATAVVYRASRRLMRSLIDSISSGVSAHMEVLLPHLCCSLGMSVRQFIPDLVSICNTYGSPFMGLVERDIKDGTELYIQRKLYHPVKS